MDFIFLHLSNFIKTFLKYGITTPLRIVHFLAQTHNETGGFKVFIENLNYSESGLLKTFPSHFTTAQAKIYARKPAAIANRAYSNRMGNGNEASGDGWKYRGRGIIQLTGKSNYAAYKAYSNVDVVNHPELAARIDIALDIAGWFWQKNNVNAQADNDDIVAVTKKVNGGTIGLAERKTFLDYYKSQKLTLDLLKKKAETT